MFAFGGAARISRDTFQKQKNFIKQFLDAYTASSPGIHVAFINYGSGEILTEFRNYDTDNLKDKVDKMRFSAGGTVQGALTRAQRVTFGDPERLRSYAIKALIVLTGDTVDDSNKNLRDASSPLILKGIKIATVAVGKIQEKRKWVLFSSGEEYVFDFSSNGDLPSLVPKVYEVIIKGIVFEARYAKRLNTVQINRFFVLLVMLSPLKSHKINTHLTRSQLA